MKQRILIIGGSRFVGPLLLDLLQNDDCELTVFNRGTLDTDYGKATHIRGDRTKNFAALQGQHFDVVYDMCAYSAADTQKLLDEVDFDFLVHFGSVASYASPTTFPIKEDHPQGEWFWGTYGSGKAACEATLDRSGKPFASLRPTYVLGANNYVDREHFIYKRVKTGQPIKIPGNGRALTQFVFVDEVAKALYLLGTKKLRGAFNCVGDDYITLVELVEQMAQIAGGKANVVFDPQHDRGEWDDDIFPFANENFLFDNAKLKAAGLQFAPLLSRLRQDWTDFYSKK